MIAPDVIHLHIHLIFPGHNEMDNRFTPNPTTPTILNASLYLAFIRGMDPAPVEMIEDLKRALADRRSGRKD